MKLIIHDHRLPEECISRLKAYGKTFALNSSGIVYEAISGHPDIFICQSGHNIILAPNSPPSLLSALKAENISFRTGSKPLGSSYPETALYNAVADDTMLIHHKDVCDTAVKELFPENNFIHVEQAYCRCNLIALGKGHYITSDKGIEKTLKEKNKTVLYVSPHGIMLPGFKHGFIGGCCGIYDKQVFFTGSLKHYPWAEELKSFATRQGYALIEPGRGPLYDGGSIVFIDY